MSKGKAYGSSSIPETGRNQMNNSRERRTETFGPSSDATLGSSGIDQHRAKRARFSQDEARDESSECEEGVDESDSDEEDGEVDESSASARRKRRAAIKAAKKAFGLCARWITRAFSPFIDIKSMGVVLFAMDVIARGRENVSKQEYEDAKAIVKAYTREDREKFQEIVQYLEDCAEKNVDVMMPYYMSIKGKPEAQARFCLLLAEKSGDARASDTTKLKSRIIPLLEGLLHKPIVPAISAADGKAKFDRGYKHPYLYELLMPARAVKLADPHTREEVMKGNIQFSAKHLPAFVYDMDEFDLDHVKPGLFKGKLLVSVVRFIFIAPSAACDGTKSRSSRAGNAAIHGCRKVTPAMIAYACVQIYFALSTCEIWQKTIGAFDLQVFYNTILKHFGMYKNWEKRILSWWQEQVFPNTKEIESTEHDHLLGAGAHADFENSGDELSSNEGEGREEEAVTHANDARIDNDKNNVNHSDPQCPDSGLQTHWQPESQTQPDSQEPSFGQHSVGPKSMRKNRRN